MTELVISVQKAGSKSKMPLKVSTDMTIAELKNRVKSITSYAPRSQMLLYEEKELHDEDTIGSQGLAFFIPLLRSLQFFRNNQWLMCNS